MNPDRQKLIQASPWAWAHFNKIQLHSGAWSVAHHEYQVDLLNSQALIEYWKKGSQMGFTEVAIIWGAHGCLFGKFPAGLGVVFPTVDSVVKYSKERWGPMITLNHEALGRHVSGDSAEQKKIGSTMINFLKAAVVFLGELIAIEDHLEIGVIRIKAGDPAGDDVALFILSHPKSPP